MDEGVAMKEIETAISNLKCDIGVLEDYLHKRPNLKYDNCIETELIKDMSFAIKVLSLQLNNGWISVDRELPEEKTNGNSKREWKSILFDYLEERFGAECWIRQIWLHIGDHCQKNRK